MITIGTLIDIAAHYGGDKAELARACGTDFEVCETEVIRTSDPSANPYPIKTRLLDKYAVNHKLDEISKELREQKFLIEDLVLAGQFTLIYAKYNSGKTLLVVWGLFRAAAKSISTEFAIYYINADDTQKGFVEKARLLSEAGINVIGPGHQDFKLETFLDDVRSMNESGDASGCVIAIDTLKRFVDVMDKKKAREFTSVLRDFTMKGGTIIALAHVNKKDGADGKPIHEGVADFVSDADCAYVMDTIGEDTASNTKTIRLECIKNRGNNAREASFTYSTAQNISYRQRLESFRSLDQQEVVTLLQSGQIESDQAIIKAIEQCISEGDDKKTVILKLASRRSDRPRRECEVVLDRYCGSDPAMHKWQVTRGDRGAFVFGILSTTSSRSNP